MDAHDEQGQRARFIGRCSVELSGQEFYAIGLAPAPDHFAGLARRMFGHQRQFKAVSDVQRRIGRNLGAARRDVEDEAFNFRHPVIDRHPGRPFAQLAPRFALHFRPLIVDNHRGHPSLLPSRLGL